jgi:hypothetical protein
MQVKDCAEGQIQEVKVKICEKETEENKGDRTPHVFPKLFLGLSSFLDRIGKIFKQEVSNVGENDTFRNEAYFQGTPDTKYQRAGKWQVHIADSQLT